MQQVLELDGAKFENRPVSPFLEMGAYEYLWTQQKTTFKLLSSKFEKRPGSVPSDFVEDKEVAHECAKLVRSRFLDASIDRFGIQERPSTQLHWFITKVGGMYSDNLI